MLELFITAVFGLIVGSFLNVVINRLKLHKSFNGRSYCPNCKHILGAKYLVPLFSFLALRGKCAYCEHKISVQYPLVEALTALSFTLIYAKFGWMTIDTFFLSVLACFLIVIAVYDFKHFIIPDKVVFPGIGVALLYMAFAAAQGGCVTTWGCATVSGLAGAALISGFFFLQYVVSGGRWIGFGDVKLGILLGLIVGFYNSIALLFLSYFIGAIVGIALISLKNKDFSTKLPFGTFLALVAIPVIIWGTQIVQWYAELIGVRIIV